MNTLQNQLLIIIKQIYRYKVLLFIIMILFVYGFLIWRIQDLKNGQPSQSNLQSQSKTATNIDPALVEKIKQLQDNSVSVQSLFNQARQNPFKE